MEWGLYCISTLDLPYCAITVIFVIEYRIQFIDPAERLCCHDLDKFNYLKVILERS
jgi:hypothetical protein